MTERDIHDLITDRDAEELSKAELVDEWTDLAHAIDGPDFHVSHDDQEAAWDRRRELWHEMRDRVDEKAPACPECGSRRWHQNVGDPKFCGGCGLELGRKHDSLNKAIDRYWEKVRAVPEEAGA